MAGSPIAMAARRDVLATIAQRHGTPCFVYFLDDVQRRVAQLRDALGEAFGISYAMKCNPHAGLLAFLRARVDTLDVSSRGELQRGVAAGYAPERISFTGPVKTPACLELAVALRIGEVVVESVAEATELSAIATRHGRVQDILIRIAPRHVPRGFGVAMSGKPSQFGIDEEVIDDSLDRIGRLAGVAVRGLHVYSGTQCLKAEAVAENYGIMAELFERVCTQHDLHPRKLVFGSGLGIRYHEGDREIDLPRVAELSLARLRELKTRPRFADTTLLLETGRFLVGEAGVYLTRVVHRKHSRGAEIGICDGGMHHHLGACGHLGMVLPRPYRMFSLAADPAAAANPGSYDLYGPACTTIDVLGRGVRLPALHAGDVLAIESSGAYGPSASPTAFISRTAAPEILVSSDGDSGWRIDARGIEAADP